MSIKSSPFGGVRLTGADAKKLDAQLTYGRPKTAAVESYVRGQKLVEQFVRRGYAALP